jgi:hypothetical protein
VSKMRRLGKTASIRRTPLEVPDAVARRSGFWSFVGTIVFPAAGVVLLAVAVGSNPRVALHYSPSLLMQPSAGSSQVVDFLHQLLQVFNRGSLRPEPTIAESLSTEQSPVQPSPAKPLLVVPAEFLPLSAVHTNEPPGRVEPAPLQTVPAELLPLQAPVETQPDTAQPKPVELVPGPPPVVATPQLPPADVQAPPTPGSGAPVANTPQVAMLRPSPAAPLEQLLPSGRGSGQKLLARLAATASIEACDRRDLPFFRVLESNGDRERLPPGDRLSHRLVYALCPADVAAELTATVKRELRGSAGVLLVDRADGLRLRPGTWAIDEELAVPRDAVTGRYTVNTTVVFGGIEWTEQTELLIE